MTATIPVTEATLAVPGGSIYYAVRGAGPLLILAGAPMHSGPFTALAELLAADHTVVTTDPRGHHRSVLADPAQDSTPDLRADDLVRLITHLDAGPAMVFGSSGGAVTTLALVQARPDLVSVAVPHEPPVTELLDDRVEQRATAAEICATYAAGDRLSAWRKFRPTPGSSCRSRCFCRCSAVRCPSRTWPARRTASATSCGERSASSRIWMRCKQFRPASSSGWGSSRPARSATGPRGRSPSGSVRSSRCSRAGTPDSRKIRRPSHPCCGGSCTKTERPPRVVVHRARAGSRWIGARCSRRTGSVGCSRQNRRRERHILHRSSG